MLQDLGIAHAGLGADPASQYFGAVRFDVEVPGSDSPDPEDHSYYYTMGSESLHSMAAIASGHGDAVGQIGALAGERMPLRVGIRAETIELPFGLGEIDLPGVDVQLPGELWIPNRSEIRLRLPPHTSSTREITSRRAMESDGPATGTGADVVW